MLSKVSVGKNPPHDVNVVIEIPKNSCAPIKYEFDKESEMLVVDRFMAVPMFYPCNYGFVPHTLSGDGDPIDVLVICDHPIIPGAVINCKPVGVLLMEDESGQDEKIIAVPAQKLVPFMPQIHDISYIPQGTLDAISHFFEYYKKLDKNKWVNVKEYAGIETAQQLINEAIARASQ